MTDRTREMIITMCANVARDTLLKSKHSNAKSAYDAYRAIIALIEEEVAPVAALSHVQAPAPVAAPVQVKAQAMTDHDNLIDRLEESASIYQPHPLKDLLSEAASALHEASLAIDDADKSRKISERERDEAVTALRALVNGGGE